MLGDSASPPARMRITQGGAGGIGATVCQQRMANGRHSSTDDFGGERF